MTTHKLASFLMSLPDMPIFVPKVIQYEDDPENCISDPLITIEPAFDKDSKEHAIALISYFGDCPQIPALPLIDSTGVEFVKN